MRDIWPHGQCYPFGYLQGSILIPTPVLASCLFARLLIGFLISVLLVFSGSSSEGTWIDSRHRLPILHGPRHRIICLP